jgi:Guanine nucleotide exchange factor in Golgi transport N-terminal
MTFSERYYFFETSTPSAQILKYIAFRPPVAPPTPLMSIALSDRPLFPLTLRCTRVVFLLLKQFSLELPIESEVFLVFLIKVIADETDSSASGDNTPIHVVRPPWMRVLAMEIMRG